MSDSGFEMFSFHCFHQCTIMFVFAPVAHNFLVGPPEPVLATVMRRKLAWFGHITRHRATWRVGDHVVEMLDGQHQRENIPAHARTAHKGLPQKRLEEDLC